MFNTIHQELDVLSCRIKNISHATHKNEALHGYVSPRVGPRELYHLEIVLKIIITVPMNTNCLNPD